MQKSLSRTDKSRLGQWWWSVDRVLFVVFILLMILGALLSMAASPGVAERIGAPPFHFVWRHFLLIIPAFIIMFGLSLCSWDKLIQMNRVVFLATLLLMVITLLVGTPIKGAKRWISVGGFSLQASEFIKPSFAIIAAKLFSHSIRTYPWLSGRRLSTILYGLICVLLLLQPDLGMTFIVTGIWLNQYFISGLSWFFITVSMASLILVLVASYFLFPHVSSRIDRFLDPESGDQYQINQSLDSFIAGGIWGVGPGEGRVKRLLPDAHADFIFPVIGEEFGFILCVFIIILFALIAWRGLRHAYGQSHIYIMLILVGLTMQFVLQFMVNVASSLHLIPTKGMTLPFLSYGGSSLLALSYAAGFLLAFSRTPNIQDKKKYSQ